MSIYTKTGDDGETLFVGIGSIGHGRDSLRRVGLAMTMRGNPQPPRVLGVYATLARIPLREPQRPDMRSNLSILHVIRAPVGGVFRHVSDLVSAQLAAGHSVGLICDASETDRLQEERIAALAAKMPLGVTRLPMTRAIGPGDVPENRP